MSVVRPGPTHERGNGLDLHKQRHGAEVLAPIVAEKVWRRRDLEPLLEEKAQSRCDDIRHPPLWETGGKVVEEREEVRRGQRVRVWRSN